MTEPTAPPRRNNVVLVLTALVTAALAVTLVVRIAGDDDEPGADGAPPRDEPADATGRVPLATFMRFDGTEGSFADYRGRPLVVNFFASWCAPCVKEMPDIEKVHRRLGDQVAFLGMDVRDRLEDGKALAARTGVTWDLARDPRGDFVTAFEGTNMPVTALVSPEGRIVDVHVGAITAAELEADVEEKLLR